MATVKEYKTAAGVTIRFSDAAYSGKSDEEKEQIREDINKTISMILTNQRR